MRDPIRRARQRKKLRDANPEKYRQYARHIYAKHKDRIALRRKEENRKLKRRVIDEYGGRCSCCGITYWEFLTIDHIDGSGGKHRQEIGDSQIYRWLKNNGFPKENFRLLCMNCNCARGFYGYCPHVVDGLGHA